MLINCSSAQIPFGNYAEFHVNGQTYTSLHVRNMNCIAGNKKISCNKGDCNCSPDGRWYSVKYRSDSNDKLITFKCIMKYIGIGEQSDEINSTILGKLRNNSTNWLQICFFAKCSTSKYVFHIENISE